MFQRRVPSVLLSGALLLPSLSFALDKEEKAWVEEVKPLMLTSEEKALNSLKSKEDRAEFQKIFWARRDPDLLTPENEFQKVYAERRAHAKQTFSMKEADKEAGIFLPISGEQTDCGLVYIALGAPTRTEKHEGPKKTREPEKWIYEGKNTGTFYFDGHCRFPQTRDVDNYRSRLKQHMVAQGELIDYKIEKGKLLKPLADMMPKPGPAQALLLQPRQDFPLASETAFVKIQDGSTGLFGLVKGQAPEGLTIEDAGGKKKTKVILRAEARHENGALVVQQREVAAEVDAAGTFFASYRMPLRPGKSELKVGVVDPVSSKGSVATQPIDVPDFNKGELTIATVFALEDIQEIAQSDPLHPYAGFEIANTRLVPRFGNVFRPSDKIQISYQFYDPKVDDTTQKPSAAAKLTIVKATGAAVAEAPEQVFETAVAGGAVGPVPLSNYPPGKYKILLKVTDKVAQKDYTSETAFEIQPEAAAAAK